MPNRFDVVQVTHFAKLEVTYIRHDVRTIIIRTEMQSQLASVGLAQARPNYGGDGQRNLCVRKERGHIRARHFCPQCNNGIHLKFYPDTVPAMLNGFGEEYLPDLNHFFTLLINIDHLNTMICMVSHLKGKKHHAWTTLHSAVIED